MRYYNDYFNMNLFSYLQLHITILIFLSLQYMYIISYMSILYRISNIYSFHILAYNICIFHMSFNFNLLYSDFFIIHITIYYTIHLYVFTIQYTIHLYVSYYSLIRILLFIYMYFTIHFIRILLFIYTYFVTPQNIP